MATDKNTPIKIMRKHLDNIGRPFPEFPINDRPERRAVHFRRMHLSPAGTRPGTNLCLSPPLAPGSAPRRTYARRQAIKQKSAKWSNFSRSYG
jgi:hypothetical protein